MLRSVIVLLAVVGSFIASAPDVVAAIQQNQNVTSNAIFGSGNVNGSYTTDSNNGVELGLRAKQRFPPANVFTNDGAGTFFFPAGNDAGRPLWSFEWSINTNYLGTLGGLNLADLTYEIRLDNDPSGGTTFLTFDPINDLHPVNGYWDHSIGTNATGQGGGAEAGSQVAYDALIAGNNLAQNSWRMDFFFTPIGFDPNVDGTYTFELEAIGATGASLAFTTIDVVVSRVPEPIAFLTWAGLIGCAAVAARRPQR